MKHLQIITIIAGLAFSNLPLHAKPRQSLPPFPEHSTLLERFDSLVPESAFSENVTLEESWSGYALSIQEHSAAIWTLSRRGEQTINPDEGSIRFWFAPSWSSGERKGEVGTLFETIAWTKTPFAILSINLVPEGDGIAVSTGGKDPFLGFPIKWQQDTWHQVAFTYSAKETVLYLDGQAVSKGPGIKTSFKSKATCGFALGSDLNANHQACGLYDDVYTFSYALTPDDVAANYRCYAAYAALGPVTPEEEEAELQRELAFQAERASAMSLMNLNGILEEQIFDCTSGPLHLTNVVFRSTNEVYVTIAGGQPNTLYDVFRTPALIGPLTNCWWTWVGRGYQCDTIQDTNAPFEKAFYIAADTTDSDWDGLTDAYESLVIKTRPDQPPAITIVSPASGTSFAAPATITVATVTSNYLSPLSTYLYANNQLIATASGDSPAWQWSEPPVGDYDLKTIMVDGGGAVATSAVVHVSITLPELASVKCWLKADALNLANNAYVTNWPDASSNSNPGTVAQANAPKFLTNQVNGLPGVKFEAMYQTYLGFPAFLNSTTQAEAFVVLKPTSGPLWSFTSSTNINSQYSSTYLVDAFGQTNATTITNSVLGGFHVLNVSTKTGETTYRLNGLNASTTTGTQSSFGTSLTLGRSRYNSYTYGNQTVAEVLIFNKVLADDQRLAVGRYLNDKYNLVTNLPTIVSLGCDGIEPRQLKVRWSTTNTSYCNLERQADNTSTTLLDQSSATTFLDTVDSFQPVTYKLTARNYRGTTNASLTTPLMLFTSPSDNSSYYVGQPVTVALTPYQTGPGGFGGTFTPAKVEIYGNLRLLHTLTNAPWSFTSTNTDINWWNVQAKTFDSAGNSRYTRALGYQELADNDSDGDGVPDLTDAYPYDPTRSTTPSPNPNDHTVPVIVITEP